MVPSRPNMLASDAAGMSCDTGMIAAREEPAQLKRKRTTNILARGATSAPLLEMPDPKASTNTDSILSASAESIFRPPSEASKKYSRPPMCKVFVGLELAPETFLQFQQAAKTYMLDEHHPERMNVVGKSPADDGRKEAKLRLWHYVQEFLNTDRNGERYFAAGASARAVETPKRSMFWPKDRQTIAHRCVPLLRKVVTNERQRLYALEARKQRSEEQQKKADVIDLTLDNSTVADESVHALAHNTTWKDGVLLHVNIVSHLAQDDRRLTQRITLPRDAVPTLSKLLLEISRRYDYHQHQPSDVTEGGWLPIVKVWSVDGLHSTDNDEAFAETIRTASTVEWMDGEVRIIVEV